MYNLSLTALRILEKSTRDVSLGEWEYLESEGFTNGCGANRGFFSFFDPPEGEFHASCNKHDFGHLKGYTGSAKGIMKYILGEIRRFECNYKFLLAMVQDSLDAPKYLLAFCLLQSIIYFSFVLLFSWASFNYSGYASFRIVRS